MPLGGLGKESFKQLAKIILGADPGDPHLDEVYPWVQGLLKDIAPLEELNLEAVEPDLIFAPCKEE